MRVIDIPMTRKQSAALKPFASECVKAYKKSGLKDSCRLAIIAQAWPHEKLWHCALLTNNQVKRIIKISAEGVR